MHKKQDRAGIVQTMVDKIVASAEPNKILLFGSEAKGTAGPDSDVDLMVIMHVKGSKRDTRIKLRNLLHGIGCPKDIVVVTPEEAEKLKDIQGTIVRLALKEGKVLYEKAA